MKQTLFIANVLSSNCGMMVPPPPDQKAIQATGKLIQEITKALVVNTIRPYIWLNSKSAAFDPVTSELLPLYRAAKKKIQIREDNIAPIQVNLLPRNKRLIVLSVYI